MHDGTNIKITIFHLSIILHVFMELSCEYHEMPLFLKKRKIMYNLL